MTKQEYMDIYRIVGIAMEVHGELGRGMAEPIYQEAFAIECKLQGIPIAREKELNMYYKGELMQKKYFADFYYNGIVIELKAVNEICPEHRSQLFNYLRITNQQRGILFNFGEESLHTERYLYVEACDDFVLINQDNYRDYITP